MRQGVYRTVPLFTRGSGSTFRLDVKYRGTPQTGGTGTLNQGEGGSKFSYESRFTPRTRPNHWCR